MNAEHIARSGSRLVHGHARKGNHSGMWESWSSMIGRCTNPNNPAFPRYGGRGITVCPRWMVFENFLADMGDRGADKSIERIDNDGNYEPGNCRWATRMEQGSNKRNNRLITHNGETLTLSQWSRRTGLSLQTIFCRIKNGWSESKAVSHPRISPSWDHVNNRI